jgi:hypothetical protein
MLLWLAPLRSLQYASDLAVAGPSRRPLAAEIS